MTPPEEQVDVVDNTGAVLYSTTKAETHQKGLLHKTVIAELISPTGEMTLVRQSPHKQDAGQYVSPVGGHVGAGETDEQALRREAKEEVGLEGFEFSLKGKAIYDRKVLGRHENHYFIVYEIYTDEKPTLNDESVSYKRFTRDKLKLMLQKEPHTFGAAFHFVVKIFYPELLA